MTSLALLRWNWFVSKLLETSDDQTNNRQDGGVEYANVLAAADTAVSSQVKIEQPSSSYDNARLSFIIGKCEWRLSRLPEGILGKNDEIENEEWKNSNQVKQPEIRMWGTTESGQKLCLHLWGVIPYFHFRPTALTLYGANNNSNYQRRPSLLVAFLNNDEDSLKKMLPEFESAMKTVMQNRTQRIAAHLNLTVEYLTNFYGYNSDEEIFIRVNILNPAHIKPLVEELVMGHILNVKFQPFGAHVPYLLQVSSSSTHIYIYI